VDRVLPFADATSPGHGAFGVVVRLGRTRVLAAGRGFSLTFHHPASARQVGLVTVLEHPRTPLTGDAPAWPVPRRLNGDETAGGAAWIDPAREQRQSEVFPIPMSVMHTGVSSCEIYRVD
jgi:Domain of unknown function (DUF5597)